MRRVSNRKVIRRLSYRTMKEKGAKNLIAVCAIALTALMFTSLFTVGMSLINSVQEATMRQVGTEAHGGFKYMTREEYEAVKNAPDIQDISYNIIVGFGHNPELYGIQTEVRYTEKKAAGWSFCETDKGRLPEKGLECATSTKVLDALGIAREIGSRVPLQIKIGDELVEETFTLTGYWEEEGTLFAEQFFVSREWQEQYCPEKEIPYNDNILSGGDMNGYRGVSIMLQNTYDMEGRMESIVEWAGLEKDNTYIGVNWAYMSSSVDVTSVLLGSIIILIIIISGYLIIYNIFYINVTTDIRYYGLLKTVGTTGKQLKSMVQGQALLLSALGIPIGLLAGWFVGKWILPLLYNEFDTQGVRNISVNPWIFIGSALFSLMVVYISCIKPCRFAAKVSPIEAIRFVERVQLKKKTKKTGRVSMLRMAAANMSRNRKKAAVVILSLSLSMVLLNSTYTLVKGFDFDKYTHNYLVGDYLVKPSVYMDFTRGERNTGLVTEKMLADIRQLSGIESAYTMYQTDGLVFLSDGSVGKFIQYTQDNLDKIGDKRFWETEVLQAKEDGRQSGMIYGIPEELFEHLEVVRGTIDIEKLKTGKYVLFLERGVDSKRHWVGIGDKIRLTKEGEEREIMAAVRIPYGMSAQYGIGYFATNLIMEEGAFHQAGLANENGGGLHVVITGEQGREAALERELEDYIGGNMENFSLVTKESLREEFASFTGLFALIGGVLCLILGIIGLLNLLNATITGILSRRQEFAMMESVGMTGSQLRSMLIYEGLIYGLWTISLAVTVGNVIGYVLIQAICSDMMYFTWKFTMLPVIACIPVIIILAAAIPTICYYALCRKSIVERLRLSEL